MATWCHKMELIHVLYSLMAHFQQQNSNNCETICHFVMTFVTEMLPLDWRNNSIRIHIGGIPTNECLWWYTITYGNSCIHATIINWQKEEQQLHGLSPQVNYTDRATAACRRSYCQLFADRGRHMVSAMDPHSRILGFLDWSHYYFFQVAPQLYSQDWVNTIPNSLLSQKMW
jgi:hypothetical protein